LLREKEAAHGVVKQHKKEFPEFIKNNKKEYRDVANSDQLNQIMQIDYENQKVLPELVRDAHEKNKALNDLNERFLQHHEIAQRVVDRQQQQQGDLHDTQRDINLLNNRQYIKKLILLTLVLVLGLIDIALFIRRITRFF